MSSYGVLRSIGVLLFFLHFGHALKCHVSRCQNTTLGAKKLYVCDPKPSEVTCSTMPGTNVPHDRCMTLRVNMKMSNNATVFSEVRNCSASVGCTPAFRDMACKEANLTSNYAVKTCEMGCCEGDLCNSGGPLPTLAPGPTGPSGSDLSCYACSSLPVIPGVSAAKTSCSTPIKQTCGNAMVPGLKQNMCLRVTVKLGGKSLELRNCSGSVFCNKAALCASMKQLGSVSDCDVSCCSGKLCNDGGKVDSATVILKANELIVLLGVLGFLSDHIRRY